jgi:hypothetical protein
VRRCGERGLYAPAKDPNGSAISKQRARSSSQRRVGSSYRQAHAICVYFNRIQSLLSGARRVDHVARFCAVGKGGVCSATGSPNQEGRRAIVPDYCEHRLDEVKKKDSVDSPRSKDSVDLSSRHLFACQSSRCQIVDCLCLSSTKFGLCGLLLFAVLRLRALHLSCLP